MSSEYAPSGSRRTPVCSGEGDDFSAIRTSGLAGFGGSASVSVLPTLVGSEPHPASSAAAATSAAAAILAATQGPFS